MNKKDKLDISKAIAEEIKGNGFREMKQRFRELSFEYEKVSVTDMINKNVSAAAFSSQFEKVPNNPLPVTKETLLEFLEKDNQEKEQRRNKTESKPVKKKGKKK